jgi:hypothetical protein
MAAKWQLLALKNDKMKHKFNFENKKANSKGYWLLK